MRLPSLAPEGEHSEETGGTGKFKKLSISKEIDGTH